MTVGRRVGVAAAADAAADAAAVTPLPAANPVPNRSETILKNATECCLIFKSKWPENLVGKLQTSMKTPNGDEERQTMAKKAPPEGLSLTNSAGPAHTYTNHGQKNNGICNGAKRSQRFRKFVLPVLDSPNTCPSRKRSNCCDQAKAMSAH